MARLTAADGCDADTGHRKAVQVVGVIVSIRRVGTRGYKIDRPLCHQAIVVTLR